MKVKLLRRAFCVAMCVVILACSSVNAFGANLFNQNFTWANLNSNGDVFAYWVNINIPPTHSSGAGYNNLYTGVTMWTVATTAVINELSVGSFDSLSTGFIALSFPSHEYWNLKAGIRARFCNALTYVYTTQNEEICDENVARDSLSKFISYAYIYYNPFFYTSCESGSCECDLFTYPSPTNWSSVAGHEIGHALGFGHSDGYTTNSIMLSDIDLRSYNILYVYDVNDYYRKYP